MIRFRAFQVILWSCVALLIVGAAAMNFVRLGESPVASGPGLGSLPYELVDTSGRRLDNETMKGMPSLLFFGYTHCPDVCPTTLAEIASWQEQLGDEARDLRVVFVSVDPERDTPEVLAEYLSWNRSVLGATGTPDQVAQAAKSWGVFYERVDDGKGSYTMEHSSSVFLVDRSGQMVSLVRYQEDTASALKKIRALVAG